MYTWSAHMEKEIYRKTFAIMPIPILMRTMMTKTYEKENWITELHTFSFLFCSLSCWLSISLRNCICLSTIQQEKVYFLNNKKICWQIFKENYNNFCNCCWSCLARLYHCCVHWKLFFNWKIMEQIFKGLREKLFYIQNSINCSMALSNARTFPSLLLTCWYFLRRPSLFLFQCLLHQLKRQKKNRWIE